MKIKRFVSLALVLTMLVSVFSLPAFAGKATSEYVPDYDTETPVIIVHGMSQNDTYLLDENGNRVTDKNGDYVTGWPLEIDIGALLKIALLPLIKSIVTRQDCGLSDSLYQAAYEALYVLQKDSKGNYLRDVEVPCYECPMSELSDDVKAKYYKFLPIQELGEIIGEDNVYYFGYDSVGDVFHETEKLHNYIHNVVMPQTGAKEVKLCHISLGGTIAVNYLESYPEDYDIIKRMVFVEPAIDGSNIIGDLLTNNVSVFYNNDDLYENLMVTLLGETPLAYLLNMVLRILPEDVMKQALKGLVEGVVNVAIRPSTILWALCPTEYYEDARAIWLADEEYAELAAQVDKFMEARANFEDNLFALMETGTPVYDVVCYDVPLFPLCKDYKTTNADRVIHAASTSMGATFANLGETLGEGYKAAGTHCSNPKHNHLSPDGVVDATTGLLPCTTWYFKGQAHELLPLNDVALKLSIRAMVDDNMVDVYSNPAYPQFNTGRLTGNTSTYIAEWEEADKRFIPAKKEAAVEAAIAEVKALENETIVDIDKWTAAEENLENALVDAWVIKDPDPSVIENILTVITKTANKSVNKLYEVIG